MYLLILESIGTWELLLVGMVALIVFGPRKIPEMARKAGKMMAEFRKVSTEFRSTWEREATLGEDEKSAFDFSDESLFGKNEPESAKELTKTSEADDALQTNTIAPPPGAAAAPEIREVTEAEKLEHFKKPPPTTSTEDATDKENWL